MDEVSFSWVSFSETLLGTLVGALAAFLGSWVLFLREKRDRDQTGLDGEVRSAAARALWEAHVFAAELRRYNVEAMNRAWASGLRLSGGATVPPLRDLPTAGSVLAAFEVLCMVAESTGDGFAGALRRTLDVWQERERQVQPQDVESIAAVTGDWARGWREKEQSLAARQRLELMAAAWLSSMPDEDPMDDPLE